MDRPHLPYVLFVFDRVMALYAGVSPNETIGEPIYRAWKIAEDLISRGYEVRILTWRRPPVIWGWMSRARLLDTFSGMFHVFNIVQTMPAGHPILWVTEEDHLDLAEALPDRRK